MILRLRLIMQVREKMQAALEEHAQLVPYVAPVAAPPSTPGPSTVTSSRAPTPATSAPPATPITTPSRSLGGELQQITVREVQQSSPAVPQQTTAVFVDNGLKVNEETSTYSVSSNINPASYAAGSHTTSTYSAAATFLSRGSSGAPSTPVSTQHQPTPATPSSLEEATQVSRTEIASSSHFTYGYGAGNQPTPATPSSLAEATQLARTEIASPAHFTYGYGLSSGAASATVPAPGHSASVLPNRSATVPAAASAAQAASTTLAPLPGLGGSASTAQQPQARN